MTNDLTNNIMCDMHHNSVKIVLDRKFPLFSEFFTQNFSQKWIEIFL